MSAQGSSVVEKPPKPSRPYREEDEDDGSRGKKRGARGKRPSNGDQAEVEELLSAASAASKESQAPIEAASVKTEQPKTAHSEKLSAEEIRVFRKKIDRAEKTVRTWGMQEGRTNEERKKMDQMLQLLARKRELIDEIIGNSQKNSTTIREELIQLVADIPDTESTVSKEVLLQQIEAERKNQDTERAILRETIEIITSKKKARKGVVDKPKQEQPEDTGGKKEQLPKKEEKTVLEESQKESIRAKLLRMQDEFFARIEQQKKRRTKIAELIPEGGYFNLDMCGVSLDGLSSEGRAEMEDLFHKVNGEISVRVKKAVEDRDTTILTDIARRFSKIESLITKLRAGKISKESIDHRDSPDVSLEALGRLGVKLLPSNKQEEILKKAADLNKELHIAIEAVKGRDDWIEPVLEWNDGKRNEKNVVGDAPKPADVPDVPAAPASPEPDPAASASATDLELADTSLGEGGEDDVKPKIFHPRREVPEGVSDDAPYQAQERTRGRVQELRSSVLEQEGFVRDANEEYTAADVKLSDMVKLRNAYGARLSSFFGKFFAKESVLARCDNDIRIQQAYWEEKKHAAEIERENLRDLQKELSLAEQELREISGEEAVDIASEGEPEERAENLPEDLDAARKAYAEAWARNPDGIEEAKKQYEQVMRRLKQEKIDHIKEFDGLEQEAAYAEVSMFFYEEAIHLSDAQVEAKRRRPDFPEKLAATIERVGKAWNKIPLSAKLAIGGVLAVSAAAVPPAGLVVAALRRSLSLAGSFTAASGIAKKWDAAARKKDREAERSVRKDAARNAFSLKDGFDGKEQGEEAKILFIESALGRVLNEDIELLDARAEKLRKKTAQRKWGARIGAIALGEAIIHGADWAREYFAENFDNVASGTSSTAASAPEAEAAPTPESSNVPTAAPSAEQPAPTPAPEVTSSEVSSKPAGFMRAAYSSSTPSEGLRTYTDGGVYDVAPTSAASAADVTSENTATEVGVPVPDSGDFSAQAFVSGDSQRITILEGGSVEGEIRKALEANGMSHEASGSAAHRIVLEHGGSFDDVKPGAIVTFDGVDGETGLPKIAGMTPPEGVSMEAGAPQMSVTDSSEAVPVSSELEIQPGSAGASEPYAAITRESALHIRNAYEALDPIVRVEFDTTREAFTKGIFTGDAAFEDTEQLLDRNVNDLLSLQVLDEKTASNLQSFRDAAAQAFPGKQIFSEPIGAPLPKETLRDYIERVTMFVYHAKHQGAPVTIGNFGGFREIF